MEKSDLIKFLLLSRSDRIQMNKYYKEGYFDQYPDRKEPFEEMYKRKVRDFLAKNPNAMEAIKSTFKCAKAHLAKSQNSGNEAIARTDQLMIDDIQYIFDISEEKDYESKYLADNEFYQIAKIVSGASCLGHSGYMQGIVSGGQDIAELLKSSSPHTIEEALKMAETIDNSFVVKGSIASTLDLEIFKAGLRSPKGQGDLGENTGNGDGQDR